jgi:F0F1-type ATP synthase delta subunit
MRRVCSRALAAHTAACAQRFLTPAEDLKKLYESDFEKSTYPAPYLPNDASVFAQFLYKAGEQKNSLDAIQKDFGTIEAASKKLPVFWERTVDVEKTPEFKGLNPATLFTLRWMQANGVLGELPSVKDTFETFINAKANRVVAKIYLAGPEKDHAAAVKEAKETAKKMQQASPKYAKSTLEFQTVVDPDFESGYAVELGDKYTMAAKGRGEETGSVKKADTDYTNLPAHTPSKTVWDENIETEVLRKYLDQMAKFDLEEQQHGV